MAVSDEEISTRLGSFEEAVDGDEWHESRLQKKQELPELLSEDRLNDFEEGDVRELVRNLWAFGNWTDKDYIVDKITDEGVEPVAERLQTALHETDDRAAAFGVLTEIPRFGPATASEILMFTRPQECGIANRRSREALDILSYDDEIPNRINGGEDYEKYMITLSEVLSQVSKQQPEAAPVAINDYVDLDYFLYHLSETEDDIGGEEGPEEVTHGEIQTMLEQIGQGLGFDVQTEYQLAAGARIDVRWKSRVANLGTISYFFEVHDSGSRDSAILNLRKAETNAEGVQRVAVVSEPDKLDKFRADIDAFSADFAESVSYLPTEKVIELNDLVDELQTELQEVGLME
jgi:hypothetical protein